MMNGHQSSAPLGTDGRPAVLFCSTACAACLPTAAQQHRCCRCVSVRPRPSLLFGPTQSHPFISLRYTKRRVWAARRRRRRQRFFEANKTESAMSAVSLAPAVLREWPECMGRHVPVLQLYALRRGCARPNHVVRPRQAAVAAWPCALMRRRQTASASHYAAAALCAAGDVMPHDGSTETL
jgi:hypothetical protein